MALEAVNYIDQLSIFRVIPNYLKVVNFIEEIEHFDKDDSIH